MLSKGHLQKSCYHICTNAAASVLDWLSFLSSGVPTAEVRVEDKHHRDIQGKPEHPCAMINHLADGYHVEPAYWHGGPRAGTDSRPGRCTTTCNTHPLQVSVVTPLIFTCFVFSTHATDSAGARELHPWGAAWRGRACLKLRLQVHGEDAAALGGWMQNRSQTRGRSKTGSSFAATWLPVSSARPALLGP